MVANQPLSPVSYKGVCIRYWLPILLAVIVALLVAERVYGSTRPPHYRQWLCIYKYENAGYGWKANTGNGYYGGLQMDIEFQKDHGLKLYRRKGTANHWTPLEQMWAAEHAWKTRGFSPWRTTAGYCGLI